MRHNLQESEAHETLKRALDIEAEASGVPTSLEEAARELGISEHSIARAQLEVRAEKIAMEEIRDRSAFAQRMFWWHLSLFILVNVFGVMIEDATRGAGGALVVVALGWAIGLLVHGISAFKRTRQD